MSRVIARFVSPTIRVIVLASAAPATAATISRARPITASSSAILRPSLLVRLDPGRRHAGIPEHPVGERPLAGRAVVLERQPLALVRQVVERSLVHRLPDLAIDQRLARRRGLRPALGSRRCGFMARS